MCVQYKYNCDTEPKNDKAMEMSKSTTVNVRMDSQTKDQAVKVLSELGLSTSEAIKLFFKQIALTKSIPFEIKIPNKVTLRTIERSEAGEELKEFDRAEELYKDLGI